MLNDPRLQNHPQLVRLMQNVEQDLRADRSDSAGTDLRKILEYILKEYYLLYGTDPGEKSISDMLKEMSKNRWFGAGRGRGSRLSWSDKDLFYGIRSLGNGETHVDPTRPDQGRPSSAKATAAYEDLNMFLPRFLDEIPALLQSPAAARPAAARPVVSQPVASQPAAARPVVSQPAASQPAASRPVVSQPVASQPAASRPAASRPAASRPAVSQSAASQPAAARPAEQTPNLTLSGYSPAEQTPNLTLGGHSSAEQTQGFIPAGYYSTPEFARGRNIFRNDPCPCGSGKKYKNCHGRLVRYPGRPLQPDDPCPCGSGKDYGNCHGRRIDFETVNRCERTLINEKDSDPAASERALCGEPDRGPLAREILNLGDNRDGQLSYALWRACLPFSGVPGIVRTAQSYNLGPAELRTILDAIRFFQQEKKKQSS